MKLNPQQAPLYGQCVVTVQLADEELAADEEGVDYFLLFAGSTQRHLTSTLRSNHDTLYAMCPAHDCCEVVLVTLCSLHRGAPQEPRGVTLHLGLVVPLAEQRFSFVQDLAFDMAQFLVSTAGRADGLDGALLLDECQIPVQECERLDEGLALALDHLALPPGWSLLGRKLNNSTDLNPQETLLHFSARRGLLRVTHFLLQQSGAREALRLANREGHTPSAIAALRGHKRVSELLTKAEADAETDRGAEMVQPVSPDARVVSHFPRLNTHTLTLSFRPGHVLPTLQRSVEQLLHSICHLHAKGASVLELPFDSLHTAAECCDGVEAEIACPERGHLPAAQLRCLGATKGGRCAEDGSVGNSSSVRCGHSVTGNAERDWGLSVSIPKTEVRPQEHGAGPPEDWVCLSSNTGRDYCQTEEEEEREQPVSTQALSLCDRSDGVQSEAEGVSLTVGIVPAAGCGKQAEETDRREAVIREKQEAATGKETPQPEVEDIAVGKEETISESADPIAADGDATASDMGQSSSAASSDPEMKDSCQDAENVAEEEMELRLELCARLSLHEERADCEGLTDLVSTPGDRPDPPPIDSDDVIEGPESAVPCILIEGLHQGEPPPDTNSLEQNQETAVGDYAIEQQWGSAPETGRHSGNFTETVSVKERRLEDIAELYECSAKGTDLLDLDEPDDASDCQSADASMEDVWTEKPEKMPSSSNGHTDLDSGMNHAVSSDDDGSFRSMESSTTEIFHPTQVSANVEDRELLELAAEDVFSTRSEMEDSTGSAPGERSEQSLTVDAGLPLEVATDCCETGAEPEPQLSPSPRTVEALEAERAGEDLVRDLSGEDLLSSPASSESGEPLSQLNAGMERLALDVTRQVLCEPFPSAVGESEVIDLGGRHHRSTETGDGCPGGRSGAEEGGDVQLDVRQPRADNSEMAADDRPPDEGLTHSESHTDASSSQGGATHPESEDDRAAPPSPNRETLIVKEMTEDPTTLDIVDAAPQITRQEVEVLMSGETKTAAGKKENGPAEEAAVSPIHRDRDASFHQPCSAQRSVSSQSSVSPSLPSRTSSATSCPATAHRDSGSDIESFLNTEPGCDSVFRKNDEPVTGGDTASEVSVSCSSTDDTASVGPCSSSPEGSQGLECSWSPEEGTQTLATIAGGLDGGGGGGGAAGEAEEEAKDRVTEVPRRSGLLRNSIRSVSPLRRHSWGPGKNNVGDAEMNQRSSVCSPRERKPTFHRRRLTPLPFISISRWPPDTPHSPGVEVVSSLSYSLEGLSRGQDEPRSPAAQGPRILEPPAMPRHDSDDKGSLVSLTEEQDELGEHSRVRDVKLRRYRPLRNSCPPMTLPLTKSVSMLAISQRDIDVGGLRRKRRISFSFSLSPIITKSKSQFLHGDSSSSDNDDNLSMRSFSSTSGSVAYSISEEEPGPLRSDTEGKSVTKVSRTFSYLKSKMYKKTREKDREKKEKEKESKEKDKRAVNGHLFAPLSPGQASQCSQCNKAFSSKEAFHCSHCNASVHKGCRDCLPACAKVKMKPKQQFAVPDSSSLPAVTMRNKSGVTRDRPWSAILTPEDHSSLTLPSSRKHTSIMSFHGNNLSKSLSISNIAGPVFDEMPIKGLRYLSQSTDSLNRTNQVTESMESLTDEGTEMMDGQLMGEFESEAKELEADSWSLGVEQQCLQQLDRELVKRQDVIYELMQTEMHHIRTLRIMSEVYSKGLHKELQLELQTVEKLFPALDELLELHTQHLLRLLERKRESQLDGGSLDGGFIINRIGDILLNQFSGSNGEIMKRVYGRFCSRHNEAVNFYKDLLTKDKRFKAFIKKKMSSSIVRRLGIPECILLVTQRITKYPVLIQRMLQHTKETEEDYADLMESVRLVKEVIAAVDSKVNDHEKRRRLKEFHGRTDCKSIMMMKSGQIFAREDLLRRRLIHDGVLQLKNCQGRLKDVHALLLSDVFVFLQEKDQKYVFAMLDQRSTVISLQKLIVREVANEERGLFLITAGIEKPEMMEVLASSKDERNTWMQFIQDAMQSMDKDEDEGIPSETEDDKKQLETKAKEMRDLLKQKDTEIMCLLEEKVQLFRGMWEGLNPGEDVSRQVQPFFRSACSQEPPKGASVMKDALHEVETLQALVNDSLGGAMASIQEGGAAGPVTLPRRAETFGGFDSHQMHSSKSGDRDESEDTVGDLRRTESDSVLKKGGNANVLQLLKRNSEQVLHSVSNLHLLLSTLQAVVVQQDSFIEDQRQALSERSSSCSSLSRSASRPSSLIEQEKQRSLEKQRQEVASLQRQQAAHAEEKRRREREWELREQQLTEREGLVRVQEEEIVKRHKELEEQKRELQHKKEEYQRDLERLRDAQRKLERDREAVQRQLDKMEEVRLVERTPSTTSDESHFPGSSRSLELDPLELSSSFPSLQPQLSKPKGKGLNPFTSSSNPNLKGTEANNQITKSLLQLAKNKSKVDKEKKKKKKKGKGGSAQTEDPQHLPEPPLDGEIVFC